jgi:hypothetical protein
MKREPVAATAQEEEDEDFALPRRFAWRHMSQQAA